MSDFCCTFIGHRENTGTRIGHRENTGTGIGQRENTGTGIGQRENTGTGTFERTSHTLPEFASCNPNNLTRGVDNLYGDTPGSTVVTDPGFAAVGSAA
ncbi:hypothetical protein HMPREF3098_02600 [Corynebacterium sp. HMSC28B08]|nr:hypothetical protein HMPREF3098_02600 [Corynebacterium sp. HMSC28B08]